MFSKILSIIFVTYGLYGFTSEPIPQLDDALLSEIIAMDHPCITNITEDKVYISPEKISPTENGLILDLNQGLYVVLPFLGSDTQGCFVQTGRYRKVTKPCPLCGWERTSGALKCSNPACPSNKPKDKK